MARGNGIRGSRVGAGPSAESERGVYAERIVVTFWCAGGHSTKPVFAVSAEVPRSWDCQGCGRPAGLDRENPPVAAPTPPFKSHLAYVRDRRSDAEAEIILSDALAKLRVAC